MLKQLLMILFLGTQENVNQLFAQCCIALRGDYQIKLVNALQV